MVEPAPPVRVSKYLPPGPSSGIQPMMAPGPSTAPCLARPPMATTSRRRNGPFSHSPRAGRLPDGRELFVRKQNMRRNWEPVRDHFCESCGGLYPRTPFDWEDVGFKEDGKKLSALRKRCSACTFPGSTQKLNADRSKAVEGYIRRLHPNFNLPEQLHIRPTPINRKPRQGLQANSIPAPVHQFVHLQPKSTIQPLDMRPQESLIPRSGQMPSTSAPQRSQISTISYIPGPTQRAPRPPPSAQALYQQRLGAVDAIQAQPMKQPPPIAPVPRRPVPVFATAQSPRKPVELPSAPPPAPIPSSSTSKVSMPHPKPTQPSVEMFEALRRAFDLNPEPSPDVLKTLAVTFNITDVRVLGELFNVWRQQANKSTNGKKKGFEQGSLDVNGQETPDSSFGQEGVEGLDGDDLARRERESLQRIAELEWEGLNINPVLTDGEKGVVSRNGVDSAQDTTIAPRSSPPSEDPVGLQSNGLLSMPISDEPMQVDREAAVETLVEEASARPAERSTEAVGLRQAEIVKRAVHTREDPRVEEAVHVIIPGMEQTPSFTPVQSGRNTPVPAIERLASGAAYVDVQNDSRLRIASARSTPVPSPGPTPPPQVIPRAPPTSAGPSNRPPPPTRTRPKEGVTIVDCPIHEVKQMSDPTLQRAYEIFTAPEPTRLANWLSVVFKSASEKYSVMQKDVYTEYKSLFEGSTEPCATGQQVVRMCLDIWPDLKLGKRLDHPSQFRMWGLYRVRVYGGSPWEALYNGELKRKLGLSNPKPVEMAASESGVLRVGAPIDSLASAFSTARLDQGKMRLLSDGANARELEELIRGIPIPDSLSTWQTKTTPKGAAVTSHRLSKLSKVYCEPTVRPKRRHRTLSVKRELSRMRRMLNPEVPSSTQVNGSSHSYPEIPQAGPSSSTAGHQTSHPASGTNHASSHNPNMSQTTVTSLQIQNTSHASITTVSTPIKRI